MDKKRLNAIFDDAPEAVLILNSYSQIVFFNTAAAQLLQYELSELEGQPVFSVLGSVSPHTRSFFAFNVRQETATLREKTTLLRKNGTLPVHFLLSSTVHENTDVFIMIIKEWQQNGEANLPAQGSETEPEADASKRTSMFLEHVFHHLPDAILITDLQGKRLIDCNEGALALFGADKQTFIQHFAWSALVPDPEVRARLQTPNKAAGDFQYTTLQGNQFWGRTISVPVRDAEDHFTLIQISDITRQKEQEKALLTAKETAEQTLKSREDFLSTMSHEIRTPLNAILGMTHLMLQKSPREDQKKLLQTLKFAGDNLVALINDILDYSKIEAGRLSLHRQDFNLKEFIHGVKLTYKNLANDKGLIFRLLLEEEVPVFVHGDMIRFGQILNNLLNNAIKFTEQGQVVVSVYAESESEQEYRLIFEVADTGIGIPQDKQQVIFDPYQQASADTTARFGGTGLGLSIVRHLIDLQAGELSLQSKEGEGTTFRVKIPFGKPENPTHKDENKNNAFIGEYSSLEGLRVLYVEDVIPNQLLMEGLCDHWKVDLDTALNGLEALEKVKNKQYDLILMDIQMPEKDGYETALEIRDLHDPHYRDIPIIALSASVSENTQKRIQEAGMNDYVPKPIDPKRLHEKLSRLSKPAPEQADSVTEVATPTITYQTDTPDFSQLHELYLGDDAGYVRILEQIYQLTLSSIAPMVSAMRDHNENLFRFTAHKIVSYVRLTKLQKLEALLEVAKDYLAHTAAPSQRKAMAAALEHHFNHFIEKVNEELNHYH